MLICNPLTNSYFQALSTSFALLLTLGLLGVIIGRAQCKDETLRKQLLLRWQSWSLIAVSTLLALSSGTLALASLSVLISSVCVFEFVRLTKLSRLGLSLLLTASLALPLTAALSPAFLPAAIFCFSVLVVLFQVAGNESFEKTALALLALFYLPVLSSHAVLLYKIGAEGPALLAAVVCASALANIFAFIFGKVLKGAKLAPLISPNKTWWGVLGSVVGAYLGFVFIVLSLGAQVCPFIMVIVPPVVAGVGVVGDLFESLLKRSFHAKDAGTWLPGFGGALDRVDGLLFVLPSIYYLLEFVL